jgi:hypothetical protein
MPQQRIKIDDVKDSFYKKLECVFNKFPKYHMENLLGDFNVKVGMEGIFKQTVGNENLHKINNNNGVRAVNFATSKNLIVKSMIFPGRNVHKYTSTLISPEGNPTIRLSIF